MARFQLSIPEVSIDKSGSRDIKRLSNGELNGISELARSIGLVNTRGDGMGKPKEMVQLLACKQEIGGKRIWGDNGLLTKTYSCLLQPRSSAENKVLSSNLDVMVATASHRP